MDIRKVERRFIDVRNPDHTIKKEKYPWDNKTGRKISGQVCPICDGRGFITYDVAVDERYAGEGADMAKNIKCDACGGSGKYEDYKLNEIDDGEMPDGPLEEKKLRKPNPYKEQITDIMRRRFPIEDEDERDASK